MLFLRGTGDYQVERAIRSVQSAADGGFRITESLSKHGRWLGEDGSEIKLDQSESTMRDLAGTAAAHWIVPVG